MANTYTDDVALLKQELAQFLLGEIASAQGGAAFRREVGDQVAVVIDQILDARLKPALDRLERQSADQAQQTRQMIDDALRDLKAPESSAAAVALEQKLSDIAGRLDDMRQRMGKVEDTVSTARPAGAATAQPMRAIGRADEPPSPERVPLAPRRQKTSSVPSWIVWILLALIVLMGIALGNLYYDKINAPAAPFVPPQVSRNDVTPPPAATQTAQTTPALTTPAQTTPTPPPAAVSVPPQNPAAMTAVTPHPPATEHTLAPPPHSRVPADIAIERGWLAAQPYALDTRLARRAGVTGALPTLKTLICGSAPVCGSDSLFSGSSDERQLIALQMIMSQIGDRFCTPRRSVAVNGSLTGAGLSDLAAIASCAGGGAVSCSETQNRACPPDADSLQAGSPAARAALLRWALWKTGST